MNRAKRLYILLGVLVVVCAAAVLVLRMEQRQEQIKTSGETVLEIDPDTVQTLSWTYEDQTLSFHRDESWIYDGDEAFPVDGDKIAQLLEQFEAFNAAFTISEVENYGQYGLDDPQCTISLTAGEQSYEILLGSYSTMDSQRYVSFGDGNVYLAVNDPLDAYGVELKDLILDDQIPGLDQVTSLTFSGVENYEIFYQEDSGYTYSDQDLYFTQQNGETLPLDTDLVEGYLDNIRYLVPGDYVTYNVTDQELQTYGLDDPELTVTADYTYEDEDGNQASDTFTLHISRDPEERSAAQEEGQETEEDEEEEITAYLRVGDSQIVYQLSGEDYTALMAASYDQLRHKQVLWADPGSITQLDISLEGESYTLTFQEEDGEQVGYYLEEKADTAALQDALEALEAEEFTSQSPSDQLEIQLTVYLDNENFPQVQIQLYRQDGTHCLAVVDGQSVSLVPRSQVVDLTEAVRELVWQ